jgi:hypothetical protein
MGIIILSQAFSITLLLKLGTPAGTESRSFQIYSLPFFREIFGIKGQNNLKLVLCMTLMQSYKTLQENSLILQQSLVHYFRDKPPSVKFQF